MYHGEYTLNFRGHALFHHSTVKEGNFNVVRSLDAPQVTTIYGALAQCASMMELDLGILDRVSITPPEPISPIIRNMLVFTAPLSPFDWQPKWVDRSGRYRYMMRVYPRKVFPLWRPRYRLQAFAEDKEAVKFVADSFRLLADYADARVGGNLRLGHKKKLFGAFDCESRWDRGSLPERNPPDVRVCEVFSDCPTRFNAVVPLQPRLKTLTFRNVHRRRGVPPVVHCSVYAPKSVVLLKQDETRVRWFGYKGESLGVSELVEHRHFGSEEVKAVQGIFLTHE